MTGLPISVVIPAVNAELFLSEAVESVKAQTCGAAEIIVVDNGSEDRTLEVARKLGVKTLERKDLRGPAPARNYGIQTSQQEWIAFLDADDRWLPQKLEKQWAAVQQFPDAGIVSCYVRIFENDAVVFEESIEGTKQRWTDFTGSCESTGQFRYFPKVEKSFFPRFQPSPSDVLIRRDVFGEVGLFDETLEYCEDLEMFLRILARYPLAIVEKSLVENRRHAGKMSFHFAQMRSYLFAVINKVLEHPEQYPPGAGEVYRDILKKNFFLAEKRLSQSGH
jgi:glycosyltransferase involved in cell wall biosynthesis